MLARIRVDRESDGFSLLELLAVLVIISIVFFIGIYMYNGVISSSRNEIDEQSKDMLMDAVDVYIEEFRGSENWKEGNDVDEQVSFCVSISNLINTGYYKGDENIISEWKDKYLVKVVVDRDGIYNYELINSSDSYVCEVNVDTIEMVNQIGNYKFVDEDSEVATLDYTVTKKDELVYTIDNVIKANILPKIEVELKSYITLVLDRSGSMKKYLDEEEGAAISLVDSIVSASSNGGLDKAQVALVEYATKPYLSRNFSHAVLNKNVFHETKDSKIGSGTNTPYAVTYAMMLNEKLPNDGKKFIILLYDGEPYGSMYYTSNSKKYWPYDSKVNTGINSTFFKNFKTKFENGNIKTKNFEKKADAFLHFNASVNYLLNNTDITLIVVGFRNKFDDKYKVLSSSDNELCADSGYSTGSIKKGNKKWYCYYESDKGSLKNLFDSLSKNIRRSVNDNLAAKIKVILTPTEDVVFIKDGKVRNEIIYDIDLVNPENNNDDYSYDIKINSSLFDDCVSCNIKIDMFNAKVIYYNADGVIIKEGTIDDVPSINLTYDRFSAIN